MSPHFWCLLLWTLLKPYVEASVNKSSMDKLGLHNYNDIVRDLIKNWESPIVYLRQLGYLPSDYVDTSKIKPNLDALMDRIDRYDQLEALSPNSADQVDKSKEHIWGTVDTKNQKMVKKREMKSVDYPTVDQLMEMTQHFKPDQSALKQAENAQLLQRLVEKTSPAGQQAQDNVATAGPVATAAASAQFTLMPKLAMLKLLSGNIDKEPTQILSGISESGANSAMMARIKRSPKSTCCRILKHHNI
ncbi:uncharacterized protein LOC6559627 isoform X2 [Drosophila grimshawi]|uniref:uncharacterized protein LOC6559627 isoform X2 n=1 Tax=Drosophila grimshawi TaxID=7222 RepID=UPI000C870A1C|nr:uncharacterized protein LOC6559627 isoform X2 [Drosophila grimshawi]